MTETAGKTLDARMDLARYDFLDFGTSDGSSIEFGIKHFGAQRGLGIDLDPNKIRKVEEKGYDALQADFTSLSFPQNSVRFVIMSHVLEHLPGYSAAVATLDSASRVASEFLFIRGPYFDADAYLRGLGFKFYWSDWRGHTLHLTTRELIEALDRLDLRDYRIMVRSLVRDSMHPSIHPLDSPPDQHGWKEGEHPDKIAIPFDIPIYREMIAVVKLTKMKEAEWTRISRTLEGSRLIFESNFYHV